MSPANEFPEMARGKTLPVIYHRFGITNHRFLPEPGNMIRKPSPLSSRMLRELQQTNSDIHQCQMRYDVAPNHGSKSFHMKAMTSQKQLLSACLRTQVLYKFSTNQGAPRISLRFGGKKRVGCFFQAGLSNNTSS